jgi:hypothetical protein
MPRIRTSSPNSKVVLVLRRTRSGDRLTEVISRDGAFVGGSGVCGDFAFDRASLLAVIVTCAPFAAAAGVAGAQLDCPDLFARAVGSAYVALFAKSRCQNSLGHLQRGLDKDVADAGGAFLLIRPV